LNIQNIEFLEMSYNITALGGAFIA